MATTGEQQGPTFVKIKVDGKERYCSHSSSDGNKELISRESCRKCFYYDGYTEEYISCSNPKYK